MVQKTNSTVPYIIGAAVGGVALGAALLNIFGKEVNNYEISGNQAPVVAGNTVKGDMPVGIVGEHGQLDLYHGQTAGKDAYATKTLDSEGFLSRLQDKMETIREQRHENRLEKIAREKELYQVQNEQRAQKREARKDYVSGLKEKIDAWDHRRAQEMEASREYAHKVIEEGRNR